MTKLPFTRAIHLFLVNEGFKYIMYKGLENETSKKDQVGQDNYILVPYKHNVSLQFEDAEMRVEKIDSLDVLEMLEYTPGIDFYVELTRELIEKYLNQ